MNKKWAFSLGLLLVVSLSACGSSNSPEDGSKGKGPGPQGKLEDQECTLKFEKEGFTATVTPIAINVGGESSFNLKFWPSHAVKSGSAVEPGYELLGRVWMHMFATPSHPGRPGRLEKAAAPGEYLWKGVSFNMNSHGGIWYLKMALKNPINGETGDEAQCEIHVP